MSATPFRKATSEGHGLVFNMVPVGPTLSRYSVFVECMNNDLIQRCLEKRLIQRIESMSSENAENLELFLKLASDSLQNVCF